MRIFIADIIPAIQRFSQRLDDLTKLTNQHWVSLDDITQAKTVYIFRANNELLISVNGIVEIGSWDYLGNQSLLLTTKNERYLLKIGFFDENVIALKLDSSDGYAFFVNETKYHSELSNIDDVLDFLDNKYLKNEKYSDDLDSLPIQVIYEKVGYEILSEKDSSDLVWGSYKIIELKFVNGIIDRIYRGSSSGKYFYLDDITGKTYCGSFEEAVHRLFYSRVNK